MYTLEVLFFLLNQRTVKQQLSAVAKAVSYLRYIIYTYIHIP